MDALLRSATAVCPFVASDFDDHRHYVRSVRITRDLLQSRLRCAAGSAAARLGLDRFLHTRRLASRPLLGAASRAAFHSLRTRALVLCAEDTTFARANDGYAPDDAGALRSARDRGYVVHLATAVDPESGFPLAFLGAHVWTRAATLHLQNHKDRPASSRESMKWAELRAELHEQANRAGFVGRIVSVNDREGDAWNSLHDAVTKPHELITRATQNRALVGERLKLRPFLRSRPVAATIRLPLWTSKSTDRRRTATVAVRFARVTLRVPRSAERDQRTPLELTAIALEEVSPPRGSTRFRSLLLTTCACDTLEQVLEVVRYYGCRWGVEIHNDVLKNGLQVEHVGIADVEAMARLVAVSGPAAAEITRWVAAARGPEPAPLPEVLDRATLRELEQACEYHRVPKPAEWTLPSVLFALARIAGADVRPTRPPGWRVVWRGWKRFEEFRRIRAFRASPSTRNTTAPLDDS
jgi:hypothetical protein